MIFGSITAGKKNGVLSGSEKIPRCPEHYLQDISSQWATVVVVVLAIHSHPSLTVTTLPSRQI